MKVRMLADRDVDGLQYRANQVVDFPNDLAKSLEKDGQVDSSKAAIAYCLDELGAKVLTHETEQMRASKEALLAAETARDRIKAELAAETDAAKRDALNKALAEAEASVTAAHAAAQT